MPESIQHKLDRVRPPRVQITYDVETRGSSVKTELPFVVGIMADLSGYSLVENTTPDPKRTAIKDRKFGELDRDNFDQIMDKIGPKVTLKQEGFTDELSFKSLDEFEPKNVLNQIPSLKGKFESRTRLSNLVAKLDGNPQLQKDLMAAGNSLEDADKQALKAYVDANLHLPASTQGGGTEEKKDTGGTATEDSKKKEKK